MNQGHLNSNDISETLFIEDNKEIFDDKAPGNISVEAVFSCLAIFHQEIMTIMFQIQMNDHQMTLKDLCFKPLNIMDLTLNLTQVRNLSYESLV